MKDLYILFSESTVGIHSGEDNDTEECHTLELTFPPKISKINNKVKFSTNLKNNPVFLEATSLYFSEIKRRSVTILIGHDIDANGELMALALRDNLVDVGIPERAIRRTPLTYEGYIAIREFPKLSLYYTYLLLQETFRSFLRSKDIKKNVGFTKALALKYVVENIGMKFSIAKDEGINLSGNSTSTMVTKELTGEE